MEKLLGLAGDLGKAFLPMAADMAKLALDAGVKVTGRLGKVALGAVKKRGGVKLQKKGRRLLRKTALLSGGVCVLCCAGLILSRRK